MAVTEGLFQLGTLATAFEPVDQDYLFEARQMQALSFAAHIRSSALESPSRR